MLGLYRTLMREANPGGLDDEVQGANLESPSAMRSVT
jgi:hypothetical protein